MTKRVLALVVGCLLFSTVNSYAAHTMRHNDTASAPDRVGRVDLGLNVAGAFNDSSDDALFVGGGLAYGVTPYLAVGVEAGWQEADGNDTTETVGIVPVLADIIIRIPNVHESIVPYGILGLGGAGVYVEKDNADDVDDTGFAWKLGAGFDWFINSNWIFNFEFAYWSTSVDLPGTSVSSDPDFWTVGVGLKYLF